MAIDAVLHYEFQMDVARLDLRAVWQNASPNPEAV